MNKKNLTTKETFDLAVQNHQKNNFKVAEDLYKKVLKTNPNDFESIFLLGSLSIQTKNFNKALQLLNKAILIQPNHADAHNNLGNVQQELGELQKARSCYEKVIQIDPNYVEAYYNLGIVFNKLGELQKAISCYEKTIQINPNHAASHNNLGSVFKGLGKYQKARSCYEKAIEINPDHADAHNNLGNVLKELKEPQKARSCYEKAIQINPNHAAAYNNLGNVLKELEEPQKAIDSYEKAIEINPDHAVAYNNLGNVLTKLGNSKKAINCYEKAIQIYPNHADAYNNLGIVFNELEELQKAINCYEKAIEIQPNHAAAYNNLGSVLIKLGNSKKAINCYEKAIQINPNYSQPKVNESYLRLALNEFEIGWKKHECRFNKDMFSSMRYRIDKLWDGNYLNGTLLVWGEQGIGDHILFASMLTDLRKYAKNIILEIDKRLVNLLKRYFKKINFSNIKVINLEKKLVNNFDKHIAIGSLGQYLRKTKKSFQTTPKKYFIPSPVKEKELRNKFFVDKKFKVGISWKSLRKKHQYRNIDLTQMLPILSNTRCEFINLQFGKFDEDLQQLQSKHGIKIRTIKEIDNYNNIEDLAALINCLDLVINIQNTNADLAGALGQKTWVLVTKNQEWRWSVNEKKSLWYPTTKLFRQEKIGNWNNVINTINMDLKKLVETL